MIDASFRCDECNETINDDTTYCQNCYKKLQNERDELLKRYLQLKECIENHGIVLPTAYPKAPWLYPELVAKLGLKPDPFASR